MFSCLTQQIRPQVRYSLNLWCGIIGDVSIGPKFIQGNLTAQNYIDLLEEILDIIPLLLRRKMWFMQDGCGAHNANSVRNYLNQQFGRKWIGTKGPIRWPPRLSCLNPMDYSVWGYLKNLVYYVL